jgi:methionyl-tRNA formyltransferase
MPQRLLLLTGSFEAGILASHLGKQNSGCSVQPVATLDKLEAALAEPAGTTRLLAFCTAVIVPRRVLDALPGPSYNIHPGPPSFPGRHPECWGAYEGLGRFGATLHEMAPRVDEGPIIDVAWFDLAPGAGQVEFGHGAFRAALQLVLRWAPPLTASAAPLPHSEHRWSGRKTTHGDLEAMCRIGPEIDGAEFERRRRAFAEQPGSRMTLTLHGCEFHYLAPQPSPPAIPPVKT